MRPKSLFQGLVLLCIGLVIIHLNTIYIPGDATDYVIQYTTIIGTIGLIYLLNYLLKSNKNNAIALFKSIKLHRYNIIIVCYNFIIVGLFSIIYYYLSNLSTTTHFKINDSPIRLSMLNAIYVSLVTQTTVGYGHVTYESFLTKLLNVIQMCSILLNISFIHF